MVCEYQWSQSKRNPQVGSSKPKNIKSSQHTTKTQQTWAFFRNGRACLQKQNQVKKVMSEEKKEHSKKAVEKQDTVMFEDFMAINKAKNDGKFEFLMLKQIILKWKKPLFQC